MERKATFPFSSFSPSFSFQNCPSQATITLEFLEFHSLDLLLVLFYPLIQVFR
jgi:hypothetical protein